MSRVLAIVIPLLLAPSSLAVDPLGDDAGSGGDAGDTPQAALPIGAGTYQARLRPLLGDSSDAYAFDAAAYDVLHLDVRPAAQRAFLYVLVYDPEGGMHHFGVSDGHAHVLLPQAGRYVLLLAGEHHPVTDLPYAFDLAFTPSAETASLVSTSRWQAMEVAWTEPATVLMRIEGSARAFHGETVCDLTYVEADLITAGGIRFFYGVAFPSCGTETGTRVVVDAPVPVGELPVRLERPAPGGSWSLTTVELGGVTGKVRIVNLATQATSPTTLDVAANVSLQTRTAEGDDLVTWRTSDAGTPGQVSAPGVNLVGPRDLEVDVQAPFYGHFLTGSASGGAHVAPDGTTTRLDADDFDFLLEPALGRWTFHLDEAREAGAGAERMHLVGAFVPRLGLYTFVWPRG